MRAVPRPHFFFSLSLAGLPSHLLMEVGGSGGAWAVVAAWLGANKQARKPASVLWSVLWLPNERHRIEGHSEPRF